MSLSQGVKLGLVATVVNSALPSLRKLPPGVVAYYQHQLPPLSLLVIHFSNFNTEWKKAKVTEPELHFTETGDIFKGDVIIARYISRLSGFTQLLGEDALDQAQVEQWVARASHIPAEPEKLASLLEEWDWHLKLRTHFVGYSFTLADFAVWHSLESNAQLNATLNKHKNQLTYLWRWWSYCASDPRFAAAKKGTLPENLQTRVKNLLARQEVLQQELTAIERHCSDVLSHQTEGQKKVIKACLDAGLKSFYLKQTPSDYYEWTLERRRQFLQADSVHHLCKSLIIVNKECTTGLTDPEYSQYYCLIVQYTTSYKSYNLKEFLQSLKHNKLSKSQYNLQFADEKEALELTEFEHNGVCPLGMKAKIPIVLSDRILELKPNYFWLGGGDKDTKLYLSIDEFVSKCKPFVANITNPGYENVTN